MVLSNDFKPYTQSDADLLFYRLFCRLFCRLLCRQIHAFTELSRNRWQKGENGPPLSLGSTHKPVLLADTQICPRPTWRHGVPCSSWVLANHNRDCVLLVHAFFRNHDGGSSHDTLFSEMLEWLLGGMQNPHLVTSTGVCRTAAGSRSGWT